MKLLFLTSGPDVPSSRFRILQYVPMFERAGHRCGVFHCRPGKYRDVWPLLPWMNDLLRRAKRRLDHWRAWLGQYDVIVIERELFTDSSTEFEQLFAGLGKPLLLDIDDGVFLNHPKKFAALLPMMDLVIAGNAELDRYVRQYTERSLIVPTCVDTQRYARPVATERIGMAGGRPIKNGPVIIGWTGTGSNLVYVNQIAEAVRKVAESANVEFHFIVDDLSGLDRDAVGNAVVRMIPWSRESEISALHRFDIGIMPLAESDWAKYKCGFKIIQYMAAGIPVVATPVGVNAQIISAGQNGLLADSQSQWVDALMQLAGDRQLREQFGNAGRQRVISEYSIASQFPRLERALQEVVHRS